MRTLDPFSFFVGHSSAITGLGGKVASPDPRYCFHTHYQEVRPGPAQFRIRLEGVEATWGELTLRVHGFRADGTQDAVLVAGSRLDFERRTADDITLEVRFRAVRDVNYAFYGYFTESSDLTVEHLEITLEELEEDGESKAFEEDVATSVLAAGAVGSSASQSSALVLGRDASLEIPVSQDCTLRQLLSREFQAEAGPELSDDETLQLWSEIVCRQALIAYGAALPGVQGILVGGGCPLLSSFIKDRGMVLRKAEWQPEMGAEALAAVGHVDFLISFHDIASIDGAEHRYQALSELLSRLLVGGLGLVCFRYASDNGGAPRAAGKTGELSRNEIGQWVLRLVGAGFSAAPMAIAPLAELSRDERGRTAIVLVLRRL